MVPVLIFVVFFFIVRLLSKEDVRRHKAINRVELEMSRTYVAQVQCV
jgi:hypothetical protein